MANTYKLDITDTAWTEVSGAGTQGFITNEGNNTVLYRESDTLPSPSDNTAHSLLLTKDPWVGFTMEAGQKVYVKSITGAGRILVTLQ